jgi:hypothetical protein
MVTFDFSRFITDDTDFNVANMKLAYNKDIPDSEIRIKKLIADPIKVWIWLIPDRKKWTLNEQYPIEGRPAEAAVLIRSAVINCLKTIIQPENRFSYTTKHKKNANYENLLSMQ